jgi:hypothetical protein
MKKLYYFLFLISLTTNLWAQQATPRMELKTSGFVGPDSTKNYVVIDAPKIAKADLYKKTLTYINSLYNDPQKVVNAVEGESITINASTDAITGSNPSYKYPMSYNIVIEFRDGKIKFAPRVLEFVEVWSANKAPYKYYVSGKDSPTAGEVNCIWIYGKDDTRILFKPALKKSFDQWANNYIAGIVSKFNDTW